MHNRGTKLQKFSLLEMTFVRLFVKVIEFVNKGYCLMVIDFLVKC